MSTLHGHCRHPPFISRVAPLAMFDNQAPPQTTRFPSPFTFHACSSRLAHAVGNSQSYTVEEGPCHILLRSNPQHSFIQGPSIEKVILEPQDPYKSGHSAIYYASALVLLIFGRQKMPCGLFAHEKVREKVREKAPARGRKSQCITPPVCPKLLISNRVTDMTANQ